MIAIAVVVRPEAEGGAPDAALAALVAAGAPAPLVVPATAQTGLAGARNEALLQCTADVLALVEDDVAVDPGWWTALQAAWAEAGATALGFAGGPIVPRVVGARPAWLTDELLTSFALTDGARDGQTFHGGNVSFRADALRAVGGFWPARGGEDARDWFSDEHLAQSDLRAAGWTGRYVPGAGVARLIDPARTSPVRLLRRRAKYGARAQVLSGQPRAAADALGAVGRGAAGAVAAAAARQPGLALERAGRAAQGAGALVSEPLAHRERQPAATHTPFRHTVAAPARPTRLPFRHRDPVALVLLYHRVAENAQDSLGLAVRPATFAAQMEQLAARGGAVPLAEAIAHGGIAVTFDDGYADNLYAALPVLQAHGIPATVFVSTGHVAHGSGFWWDEVGRLLAEAPADAGPLRVDDATGARAWPMSGPDERRVAQRQLHAWLQPRLPEHIEPVLQTLRAWAGVDPAGEPPPAADRPMTVDELRTLAHAPGIEIGAHGQTHPSLAFAPPERQDAEIAGSRADLQAWLGTAPDAFSYPFGVPGVDVDRGVHARVHAAGFARAVVNSPQAPPPGTARFAVPRIVAPDDGGPAFAALLDRG